MNFDSDARWPVLRRLYEAHGIPFEDLAPASDKPLSTIENRAIKDGWVAGGEDEYVVKNIRHLIGKLSALVRKQLDELQKGGEVSEAADKQIRMLTSFLTSLNKAHQLALQLEQNGVLNKDTLSDEAAFAGEDILALRAGVEAFIVSLGEEEIDPQISGEAE